MASSNDKSSEVITSEQAVLVPNVPGATSVMPYVEAVATVIGSCHIHSVFEDQDFVKIYLNDKKFVDFLVNTGLSVLGHRVNVDYATPRADKVILKNIDPIIPDNILLRFLCFYGTPVSTMIHEKIASNLEYSHIECGTRKIYMNIFKDKKPPSKVSIQYQGVSYRFEMSVERYDKTTAEVESRTEEINEEENLEEMQDEELSESMKPNIDELNVSEVSNRSRTRGGKNLLQPTPAQTAYHNRGRGKGKNGENSITYAARKIKSRAAKGWYKNKVTNAKNIASTRAINKLVTKKVISGRGGKRGGRGGLSNRRGGRGSKSSVSTNIPVQDISLASLNGEQTVEEDVSVIEQHSLVSSATPIERRSSRSISQYPLSTEELKKLMFQTRCHRAPIQVAREFLTKKNAPNALEDLLKQLMEYHDIVRVQSLRIRIRRLVKTLKISANNKSE